MTITSKRKLGDLGEKIAADFLINKGFQIIEKNYLRKWGEIDIICIKHSIYRFIEVKTVSGWVSSETQDSYRPEDNVHPQKLKRLYRAIQTYLLEKRLDADWQLDIVTVRLDEVSQKAQIDLIENIVG